MFFLYCCRNMGVVERRGRSWAVRLSHSYWRARRSFFLYGSAMLFSELQRRFRRYSSEKSIVDIEVFILYGESRGTCGRSSDIIVRSVSISCICIAEELLKFKRFPPCESYFTAAR